ncbi:sensor histidine kinase [Hydrogenophaga sp.]|uniref:sensor histidine kinase n=1 Tax=Hydrogenophaga sp. TaxID=1904254 RepID=UPI003F6D6819
MTPSIAHTLLRWLPRDGRPGVARRGLIVWGMALLIAVFQWLATPQEHPLVYSLVYSYAISTSIWFFSDPLRIALHRWLRTEPPHFWAFTPRTGAYMLASIVLGYALGTAVGDAFSGRSTWALLSLSPQRFWGFWLSSLGISFGFLFYFYHREKGLDLERQATEARLKLLETQLEPHMLFNTLANLRALIATDPPRAIHMLDRLNDYLRATLKASRTDAHSGAHTLADEFARLRDYLELMAVRMGPRLAYTLNLPAELQRHAVPPLLLQPLVENAIRHGLEPQVEGGRISVHASQHGASGLLIEVTDTGVGMDHSPPNPTTPNNPANGSGFGLAQVRERVASLPGTGRVELSSPPGGGTTVRLHLPFIKPSAAQTASP